jgi:hypothetical protein
MDAKERFMIEQLHSTISSGSFHEQDILRLFIILRRSEKETLQKQGEKTSLVLEFGDFVAHREKDQGILKDIMQSVQSALDTRTQPIFTPITNIDIQKALNKTFQSLNLPEVEEELVNQITVCIISLLQSVKIKINAQSTTLDFELSIGISKKYIYLLGGGQVPEGHTIMFPLLVARNTYLPSDFEYPPLKLNDLIVINFVNGRFNWDFPYKTA